MPKIRVALVVEFDADQSDQDTIDLALDQILHLQPSCKIVSKRVTEIDGTTAGLEDDLFSAETNARHSRSSETTGRRDITRGDSYRPDYPERSKDQLLDSYRPGTLDVHGVLSRNIACYRNNEHISSNAAAIYPDRQRTMTVSEETLDSHTGNGGLSSSAILGTRYAALAEDMVFGHNPKPLTNNDINNSHTRRSGSHYSPPPARDRSASPQNGRRRSERLRSAPLRNVSQHETTHKTKLERWKQRQDKELKRIETKPNSLEDLASIFSAKGKFETQRERHGITEALRLKNLRSNQKIEKAKRQFDKVRWGDTGEEGGAGEVKQGARMDAVIEQIASFDFSAPSSGILNGNGSGHSATHPPVETRKKKGAGAKKRGRGKLAGIRQRELADLKRAADDKMRHVHLYSEQPQPQQIWEQQMQQQTSSIGTSGGDMAVDAGQWVDVPGGSGGAIAVPVSLNNEEEEGVT